MPAQKGEAGERNIVIVAKLLRKSFAEIKQNDPLRLAGATAFFTTFALPPIFIILFQLFSLFLNKKLVATEMMQILTDTLARASPLQIRQTTRGFGKLASNWLLAAGGFIFLIFVATTLFSVIKNSLNDIWNIGVKEKPGILFKLKLRARSLLIIVIAGLLFLASIFLDGFQLLSGQYLSKIWPAAVPYFKGALNEIVSALVITFWFIILFRYLADGRPTWKVCITGGLLTGVLFSIGKSLLSYLMRNSNISTLYGASGSIVLILLFVFYSSFILYFGASFIKVYAEWTGQPIRLVHKAYRYQLKKIS